MGDLSGKHAVVTGGGRGIGAAIAVELARHGADLTLMGRDRQQLLAHAAEISATHKIKIACVACDVADPASVRMAFDDARSENGEVHILVNNAGQVENAPVAEVKLENWRHILDVNLTGAMLCTQQVLPAMLAARDGRIVSIASTAGLKGYARLAAYCASKHGLIGFTRALALEVVRNGVTVNAVCPSFTETDMVREGAKRAASRNASTAEEELAKMAKSIPRGRLITPEEVANTVVWLCSPGASGITGQAIAVAGGEGM